MSHNNRQNHHLEHRDNGYEFNHGRLRAPEEHRPSFGYPMNHQQHEHLQTVNNSAYINGRRRAVDDTRQSGAFAPLVARRVDVPAARPIVHFPDNQIPAARPIVPFQDNQRRFLHNPNPPMQQMLPQHHCPKQHQERKALVSLQIPKIQENRGRNSSNEENITPPSSALPAISPVMNNEVSETKLYRIKLEVPASLQQDERNQIEINLLQTLAATVSALSTEQYREPGCVPYIETTYEIPYTHPTPGESFIKAVSQFTAEAPDAVTVKTCDPALLSQKLISEHTRLPLQCVRFGNVDHNGTFLSHYEITYNLPLTNRTRPINQQTIDNIQFMKNQFSANFQYGNKRIFFIELWNFEPKKNLFARYFVTSDRDHILRTIVSSEDNRNIRLIFELACPVFIKKKNNIDLKELSKHLEHEPIYRNFTIHRTNGRNGYPEDGTLADSRFIMLEFDKSLVTSTLHEVLSRLHFRTGRPIEFVSMPISNCFIGKLLSPYMCWTKNLICPFGEDDTGYQKNLDMIFPIKENSTIENRRKRFILTYHLQALVSRGAVVKDRLLRNEYEYLKFMEIVKAKAMANYDECIRLLEATILFVETRSRIKNMADVLSDLYESMKNQELSVLQPPQELTNGYQRVLSVVCTPTRVILKPPELQMGNRVTRNYDSDGTEVIRVTFRDDDGSFMRENIIGERNMKQCVRDRMVDGIKIAGKIYKFLGSSGSQQRDQGAYFMIQEKVEETLNKLGDFNTIENVHKRLAREGQCLTQSRECKVPIRRWKIEPDIKGGCDRHGKPYLFTDGAGRMSMEFAKKVAEFLGLSHYIPTALQFRCGGKKGLLVIDPQLDEQRKWAEENCSNEIEKYDYDVIFRESQHKFEGEEIKYIEVVKCSMPQATNLSRPLVNIIDQVAGMQSMEIQNMSGNRIEDLQEKVFRLFADAAVDENKFRSVLDGLPHLINFDYLSTAKGFQLHREPFLRRLEFAKARYDLKKKLSNQTIPIPVNLGRSMFGVPDSSEQLQYDQVFIQVTKSVKDRFPAASSATEIITGPVLVTKNPALAEGDVRVFMAVDIPELHDHRDVLVFSTYGERWNCDEMAGSDADGDEYSAIWDPQLLFNYNQPAFDFTSNKKVTEKNVANSMEKQRANACYDMYTKNVIGLYSDAHLVSSDLYGINAPTTISLTKKVTMALDFGKSGDVPDPMTSEWTKDPKTGENIPPEKIERRPDFKGASFQPTYASASLNGRLHRMNKKAANVISMDPLKEKITVNSVLAKKAWNEITDRLGVEIKNIIIEKARKELSGYIARIRAILDNYGIKTEAELYTGCFMEMKNKLAEREEDSGSMYTTGSTIQQLYMDIFVETRKMFFEEFGGWRQVTSSVDMYHEEDVCRRVCCFSSDELHAKALAYYKVCYESTNTQQEFLSFAWLVFDVLANVQQSYLANHPEDIPEEDSFYKKLSDDVTKLVKGKKSTEFSAFSKRANHDAFILPFLGSYGKHYTGIRSTWFVLVEWAKMCGVVKNGLTEDHLLLIFIALATQTIATGDPPFMEILPKGFVYDKENCIPLDKGKAIVYLLRAMASRKFGRLDSINFEILNSKRMLSKGEWIPLHEAARKSFYSLMINQRIEELLYSPANLEIKEWEPRVIELPDKAKLSLLSSKLIEMTGAEDILLCRMNPKFPGLVTAFIRGSQESEERFQELTQLKPQSSDINKDRIQQLIRYNYKKIRNHRS